MINDTNNPIVAVVTRVCEACKGVCGDPAGICPVCNGSGLKWADLSLDCTGSLYPVEESCKRDDDCFCLGSGRVSAMTEDQVMDLIGEMGWSMTFRDVLPGHKRVWVHSDERPITSRIFYGDSYLNVSCQALLVMDPIRETAITPPETLSEWETAPHLETLSEWHDRLRRDE